MGDNIKKIMENIAVEIKDLKNRLENFNGTRDSDEYYSIDQDITDVMIKLDNLKGFKNERKDLLQQMNKLSTIYDEKCAKGKPKLEDAKKDEIKQKINKVTDELSNLSKKIRHFNGDQDVHQQLDIDLLDLFTEAQHINVEYDEELEKMLKECISYVLDNMLLLAQLYETKIISDIELNNAMKKFYILNIKIKMQETVIDAAKPEFAKLIEEALKKNGDAEWTDFYKKIVQTLDEKYKIDANTILAGKKIEKHNEDKPEEANENDEKNKFLGENESKELKNTIETVKIDKEIKSEKTCEINLKDENQDKLDEIIEIKSDKIISQASDINIIEKEIEELKLIKNQDSTKIYVLMNQLLNIKAMKDKDMQKKKKKLADLLDDYMDAINKNLTENLQEDNQSSPIVVLLKIMEFLNSKFINNEDMTRNKLVIIEKLSEIGTAVKKLIQDISEKNVTDQTNVKMTTIAFDIKNIITLTNEDMHTEITKLLKNIKEIL